MREPRLWAAIGGWLRGRAVISLALTALLGACTTDPDAFLAAQPGCSTEVRLDSAAIKRCASIPEVRGYLAAMKRETLEAWHLPRGAAANQHVVLRFGLRADGSIRCLSLSPDSDEKIARSIVAALQRVVPLDPLPEEAACLGDLTVVADFSNPPTK